MSDNLEGLRRRIASGSSIDRLRIESSSSLDRVSSASPVLWESLIQNLSAALPVIFQTPAAAASEKDDLLHSEPLLRSERHLHPDACAAGVHGSSVQGSFAASERRRPVSGECGTETEGKHDLQLTNAGSSRSIRVRHEETEDMLNQSLAVICRQKSPRVSSSLASSGETKISGKAVGLKLKESLKSGIRVKIDISQCSLENIVVAVTRDNALNVYIAGKERKILYSRNLQPNPPVQSLACSIVDGSSLYIREKSKEAMVYDYHGNGSRFLPVMLLDETSLKFVIIFHIPDEIPFENVVIKTVDETLVIKGCQIGSVQRHRDDFSFRVIMALPESSDNRSVTAHMIEFNQVIIEGCLGLSSRRMTCNF